MQPSTMNKCLAISTLLSTVCVLFAALEKGAAWVSSPPALFAPLQCSMRSKLPTQQFNVSPYNSIHCDTVAFGPLAAAGPATIEAPTKEKVKKEEKKVSEKKSSNHKRGGWAVRLFNDPMNKREFVAMCLCRIVGLSDGQAYSVMMAAHTNGLAVVGRYDFERAELYRNSLIEQGLTCDMIPVEED